MHSVYCAHLPSRLFKADDILHFSGNLSHHLQFDMILPDVVLVYESGSQNILVQMRKSQHLFLVHRELAVGCLSVLNITHFVIMVTQPVQICPSRQILVRLQRLTVRPHS